MMKKLLVNLIVLCFLPLTFMGQQITMTSTSSSGSWSPFNIDNRGETLRWEASNAAIGTLIQDADDPTFDFSSNDGSPISIVVTSADGLDDLRRLDMWNDNGVGSELTQLDVTQVPSLRVLNIRTNNISTLDVSQNTNLTTLNVRTNPLLTNIDISTNINLTRFQANRTGLVAVSLANNTLLTTVRLDNANLDTANLDQVLIDLDNHGLSNGSLQIANNDFLSLNSLTAYNNLVARGWTIDVDAPLPPEVITLTTTSNSANWSPFLVVNNGATLEWEATNAQIGTLTQNVDDPTFDFSANNGSPITITVTGSDGFVGLERLDLWNDNGVGSEISSLDISKAIFLERLNTRINDLTTLDVSANTALTQLLVRDNPLLTTLNIDTNTDLTRIQARRTALNSISLANNTLLTQVELSDAELPTAVLDQILIDLDGHGLSNGTLEISDNAGGITAASLTAYNNLIGRGWTIDVEPPQGSETFTLITTSSSGAWSPFEVLNTGATLTWEATNGLIGTLTQNVDDPTFDFSANDGSPITITVTGTDGFVGLERLDLFNDNGVGSELTSLDISAADNLDRLNTRFNDLTTIDVSQNTILDRLIVRGNANLTALNIDANTNLSRVQIDGTGITDISLANNTLLTRVQLYNAQLTSTALDQVLIDLDGHGLSNGSLEIRNNAGGLTIASLTAYNNLIGRGWTIDVEPPQGSETLTLITTSSSGAWSPFEVLNTGATLTWEATNGLIGTLTQNVDDPTFDFSANDGSPITITVTGTDGFVGLERLDLFNDNGVGSELTSLDISAADNLDRLNTRFNDLTTIDVSQNTILDRLIVRGNENLTALNIDANTNLSRVQIDGTGITDISLANNTLLTRVQLYNAQLTSTALDQVLIDLDGHGLSNGSLEIRNNAGEITFAVLDEYNSLLAKGWTIDVGPPLEPGARLDITGNDLDIQSSNVAIPEDGTDFVETTIGNPITNSFTLVNPGDADLTISLIISSSADFILTPPASLVIGPGASETFDLTFSPTTLGTKTGSVIVSSDAVDDPVFVLNVTGDAVEVLSNQIMISQYYHGFSGTDNWVEVTNISGAPLAADTYFLALFDDTRARFGIIEDIVPNSVVAIPALATGETVVFRSAGASLPDAANRGTAVEIASNVCNFDGDDVVLISTTNDDTCYNFRVDIIGNISPDPATSPDIWGNTDCYIKGGCSSEEAHKSFDLADWLFVELVDVDNADPNTNLAIGTQVSGPTEFDGTSWSNLEPDQSRTAIISGSFSGAPNNFEACNLTINAGVDANFDSGGSTSNSIVIYGDLIVDGTLTIGDTESLVVYNPDASLGAITKLENSNPHNSQFDLTYWASPVAGSQLSTVFAGSRAERIFEYRAGEPNPLYPDSNGKYWWIASGAMEQGRGYAVEGVGTGVQSVSFSGIPYNGPWVKNLFYSGTPDNTPTANENFNLIGNPYPAAIDMQRILVDNGNVNEIALWTHSTEVDPDTGEFFDSDYVYYSTTGSTTPGVTENIASGQAFMIRTVSDGAIVISDDYKLVGRNDQFFKGVGSKSSKQEITNENKLWLRMNIGREKSDILVAFMDEATDGYDVDYDVTGNLYDSSISLIDKKIKFYSKIDDKKFVIQGMGPYNSSSKVALGFDTEKKGDFRISLTKTLGEMEAANIYLVDHALKVRHDLKRSDYVFYQTELGKFENRFSLEFDGGSGDFDGIDIIDGDRFNVSNDFDIMNVNSGKVVRDIKVYDMLGRMVIHKAPNLNSFQLNTSTVRTGTIMIIEATMEDGSLINTKSIKY